MSTAMPRKALGAPPDRWGSHMAQPWTLPSMAGALGRLPRRLCGAERGAEEGDERKRHGGGRLAPQPHHCLGGGGLAGEMEQGARALTVGSGTGWGCQGVCGSCQPQRATLPTPPGRQYLRQWELGATKGTSRWTTCTCRMEPAPSQVRVHTVRAPRTGWGRWGPHGGTWLWG